MIIKHDIVRIVYPNAVTIEEVDSKFKAWDKDGKEITIVQSDIDTEYAKHDYKNKRVNDYDSISNQLDQLYWDKKNGTNKWVEAIDKVKSDNPKP